MKKYLLFCLLWCSFSASAQLNPSWVNNFCCFDSVAPHSFSYPLGEVIKNDSIITAYFEDDSLKVKVINSNTGMDIADFNYASDTLFSPFYYGGSFIECDSGYLSATSTMDANNNSFIIFKVIDHRFNLINTKVVYTGHLQNPMSDLFKSPLGDSCFYLAHLSDSLRVFEFKISDFSSRTFTFEKGFNDYLNRNLFFNSSGEIVVPDYI